MSVLVDRLRKEAQHDEVEGGFAVALLREAADEIERLERNATAFCAEISGLIVRAGVPAFGYPQDGIRELGARIQRLEKQLAASLNDASMADKRDAERYRWLRECSIVRSDRTIYVQKNCYNNGVFRETVYPYGAYLDAEIDAYLAAALSAEKGNDK